MYSGIGIEGCSGAIQTTTWTPALEKTNKEKTIIVAPFCFPQVIRQTDHHKFKKGNGISR